MIFFMLILVRILYMAMEVMIHLLLQVMILQYVAAPVMISLRLAEMISKTLDFNGVPPPWDLREGTLPQPAAPVPLVCIYNQLMIS